MGQYILEEVGRYSVLEGGANKLETEQEREQEQEQQKEVKARRDQQVEIEKFVDREYSRNDERPHPWPLQALLHPPATTIDDLDESRPFYPLKYVAYRSECQHISGRFLTCGCCMRQLPSAFLCFFGAPLPLRSVGPRRPADTSTCGIKSPCPCLHSFFARATTSTHTGAGCDGLRMWSWLWSGHRRRIHRTCDCAPLR